MYTHIINREDEDSCVSLNPIGATVWALHSINFKRKKIPELVVWFIPIGYIVFISKILEEHQKQCGVHWGLSNPRKPNDFLPNETCSYNHIYQSEIQKEQIVPLVLMDGHLPQMSSLLKSHKPDNGNFSVIEAQSNMKCPHGEVCASVPTNRGINYLGKVLSKFSGKLALLRGKKKRILQF